MFADFLKPLNITVCFEQSISLDFVVLKVLLEHLLFCSHNLWLPVWQTFLLSDWWVPATIRGMFFCLLNNSNVLNFPFSVCYYASQSVYCFLFLFLSFLAIFCVVLFWKFNLILFCSFSFLFPLYSFVTVEQLRRCKVSSLHCQKAVTAKHHMLVPNQIIQPKIKGGDRLGLKAIANRRNK